MTNEEAIIQLEYRKDFATPMQIEALNMGIKALEQKQKTGHWISCDILQEFKCSKCRVCFRNKSSFCPNCGAKMEGE